MFELDYIKELSNMVSENELTEITITDGDKSVVIKKEQKVVAAPAVAAAAPVLANIPAQQSAPEAFVCTPIEAKKGKPVTSPMVGTFYRSSSPDSDPFVEVGTVVSEGQTVCIIEAMKLMNEIESDAAGKVIEICVEDGQAVEFGQVLMYVE